MKKSKKTDRPEITEAIFEPSAVKERITIYIDYDILKRLRNEAAHLGCGYQTLLNKVLRKHVDSEELKQQVMAILFELANNREHADWFSKGIKAASKKSAQLSKNSVKLEAPSHKTARRSGTLKRA